MFLILVRAQNIEKSRSIEEEDDELFINTSEEMPSKIEDRVQTTTVVVSNHSNEDNTQLPAATISIPANNDICNSVLDNNKNNASSYGTNDDPEDVLPSADVDNVLKRLEILENPNGDICITNTPRNLPDLDQLLPKGSNTTFADLIRVHDQLHRIEQQKISSKELKTIEKDETYKPDNSCTSKDHLQEAFRSCQSEVVSHELQPQFGYMPGYSIDINDPTIRHHSNNTESIVFSPDILPRDPNATYIRGASPDQVNDATHNQYYLDNYNLESCHVTKPSLDTQPTEQNDKNISLHKYEEACRDSFLENAPSKTSGLVSSVCDIRR